jgi:peptidoglycan/LPS O-acetylase OafA/YrhL
MNRALPLALGVSLGPALGVYALVSSVPAALGTAAVYVGAAYFYFAFDISLLAAAPRFDDRSDRLGYGVGLFGLSVTPILFAQSAGGGDATVFGFAIAFFGAVAFLTLSEQARRRRGGGE